MLPVPYLPGRLSVEALAQNGAVWINHNVYSGFTGKNHISESGVGVGLDYTLWRFSVNADYVFRVGRSGEAGSGNGGNQFWFQVSSAF